MKTIEIAGVEFAFERIEPIRGSRKPWQVSVKKTGVVLQCFSGKTLADKIKNIETTARIVGDRFKQDTESAKA